jgi:alkylresorcinol/alkylpyrone synthase
MARVLEIVSEALPYTLRQEDVRAAMAGWLPDDAPLREKLVEACDRSGVTSRASLLPLSEAFAPRTFTERNQAYSRAMVELGTSVVSRALTVGGWQAERFHSFVSVSCTGVMIPSPDVHIMNRLGFLPSTRRIPITELGCVGGAVALARTAEIVDAHHGSVAATGRLAAADLALVFSAELCSLSFQQDDTSPSNVIASMLFGDGIVALVLGPEGAGGRRRGPIPRVVASRSHVEPGTHGHLGFDLRSTGFHIVLGREVPLLVRDLLRGLVREFTADLGWDLESVDHWLIHPGGEKVIRALLDVFRLPPAKGEISREVLAERGNASSAGVLLVLERTGRLAREGERGLLVGFGPGFAIELVALEW